MIKPSTHIFVCGVTPPKGGPGKSGCTCDHAAAADVLNHLRRRLVEREMHGVRATACECLHLCQHGPVVIVYPEGTWYCNTTREKVEEILNAVWNNAILRSYSGSVCSACPTAAAKPESHETAPAGVAFSRENKIL